MRWLIFPEGIPDEFPYEEIRRPKSMCPEAIPEGSKAIVTTGSTSRSYCDKSILVDVCHRSRSMFPVSLVTLNNACRMISPDSDAEFARPTYKVRQSTGIEYPVSCILWPSQKMFGGESLYLPLVVDASRSHLSTEEMGLLGPSNDSSKHSALLEKTKPCLEAS